MIRSDFRCGVWNTNHPIRCNLHVGHLGMHSTVDNEQFVCVPMFEGIISIAWPNVADSMFGEMHDSAVLAGQRIEFSGGTVNLLAYNNQ